jgi:hypothetical protein
MTETKAIRPPARNVNDRPVDTTTPLEAPQARPADQPG